MGSLPRPNFQHKVDTRYRKESLIQNSRPLWSGGQKEMYLLTLLCIQIVLFHSFEHFSYLNTLWSQHVRISDFLLYELARSSHQASQLQTYINKVDNTVTCQAYCKHIQLYALVMMTGAFSRNVGKVIFRTQVGNR